MQVSARELLEPFFTPLLWCGRWIRTRDLPEIYQRVFTTKLYRRAQLPEWYFGQMAANNNNNNNPANDKNGF